MEGRAGGAPGVATRPGPLRVVVLAALLIGGAGCQFGFGGSTDFANLLVNGDMITVKP